jgi:predicted ATPase
VTTLLETYTEKIVGGELRSDAAQAAIVSQLDRLAQALEAREQRGTTFTFMATWAAAKPY